MTKHLSDIQVTGSVTSTQTVEGQGGVITRTVAGTPVDTVSDGMIAIDTTNNKLYYRSGGSWRESGSASSVATLTDVELTALSAGQALVYNGTKWVNQSVAAGSGAVYLATIGDGTTSTFTITHNLGTRDVVVVVRNALSPYEVIQVYWTATTASAVTLDFGMAPASNSVRVAVYASVDGTTVSIPLDGLTDTTITSPEEFQSLVYNGTEWVNQYASTVTYVRNAETTTLTTGTVVYLFGATGDHATVKRADNDTDATSSKTIGLVAAPIAASQNGPVVTRGYVDGIDLSAYTAGQVLWLGENGAFTSTKPSAPEHLVFVGVVVRATNNGIVYVATQNGYELDELHDVSISSPATGQTLRYDGSLWANSTLSLDDLGNVSAPTPTHGQFLKYDDGLLQWVPGDVPTINGLDDIGDVTITSASSYDVLQWNGSAWVNSQSLTINTLPTIGGSPLSLPTTIDDEGITLYPWIMIPSGYTGPAVETNMIRTPGTQMVISGEYVYFHPTMDRNSIVPTGLQEVGVANGSFFLTDFWNPSGTVASYSNRTGGINTTHVGAMSLGLNYRSASSNMLQPSNFYFAFTGADDIDGDVTMHVPSDMTIDNPNGTLTITGDLTVSGSTTTLNTTELLVEDNIITLNSGVTGSPSLNAGIEIERGTSTNVQIRWNETTDKWQFTNDGTTYKDLGSGGVTVSDTVPSSPATGDMWYESDTGALFAYYDSAWIEIGGSAAYNEIVGSVQAKGDLLAGTGSQAISRLGVGANGRRLVADSTTATGLAWADDSVNSVVTAKGDLIAATSSGAVGRRSVGTDGQVLVANSTATTGLAWAEYPQQFRNKFINGTFNVNQRAASSYTGTASLGRFMDNWMGYASAGTVTFSPSTVAPEGFATSLLVNVATGGNYSNGAGNYCLLGTKVEGFNAVPFGWGTAWAKPATLSFWARSSIPGMYTVSIQNDGYQDTVYVATYTITAANTWQRITITIPGPTTGTWNGITNTSRNTGSIWVAWSFGVDTNFQTNDVNTWQSFNRYGTAAGVDLAATTGAQFYMTGVQLEVGSEATAFEYRDFNTELAMCQRYYEKTYGYAVAPGTSSTEGVQFGPSVSDGYSNALVYVNFKTRKRAIPTLEVWNDAGTANVWTYSRSGVGDTASSPNWTYLWNGESGGLVFFGVGAAWVPVSIRGHWVARAEL